MMNENITDLTGTIWVFGNKLLSNYSTAFSYSVNFEASIYFGEVVRNYKLKNNLQLKVDSGNYYFPGTLEILASSDGASGVTGSIYAGYNKAPEVIAVMYPSFEKFVITITGGTDATNTTLISWLEANAILQGGEPTEGNIEISITSNGTTTLATAGKYCDRNIDVVTDVPSSGGDGVHFPQPQIQYFRAGTMLDEQISLSFSSVAIATTFEMEVQQEE